MAVSAPGEPAYAPRVAAGPRGAIVAWHRADMAVRGAWAPWDGPPGPPTELSGPSVPSVYPAPALGPEGALVAWRTHDGAVVARAAGGGAWRDPQRLAPPGATAEPPVAVAGPRGAVVAWEAAARPPA